MLRVLAVVSVTTVPAFATPDGAERSVLAEAGRVEYLHYCASCHGPLGRGDGAVGQTLQRRPADLTAIAAQHGRAFPAGEIAAFIDGRTSVAAHGTREMPVWGTRLGEDIQPDTAEEVTRGRISFLVEYLKTIQRP
jgi:mono/diheme cytochrome c family protein